MTRRMLLIAMLLLFVPITARGIQLHWASGLDSLSFTGAARCTLVVEADPGATALPPEWRLLWVATNCGRVSALLDTASFDTSAARVDEIGTSSEAEGATNVATSDFHYQGYCLVKRARYVFDLPAGGSGKFQAVASQLSDDDPPVTRVVRSGVVTFNGGATDPFPPAIVSVSGTYASTQLTVALRGTGLGSVLAADIASPDVSLRIPLDVAAATESTLVATTEVSEELATSVVRVTVSGGWGSSALLSGTGCSPSITHPVAGLRPVLHYQLFVDPTANISTKDFAFYQNIRPTTHQHMYHLFYIRHNDVTKAENSLAHAWCTDLNASTVTWTVDTCGFLPTGASCSTPSPGSFWDSRNVWAPSIVQYGDSTFMFYTGVDNIFDQRLGYAATTSLDTCDTDWSRRNPSYDVLSTKWAPRRRPGGLSSSPGRQMRDPYVFAHPDSAGRFFMVFAAGDTSQASGSATLVGLAENATLGSLSTWVDRGFYRMTGVDSTKFGKVEGPIMIPDKRSSRGWLSMFTDAQGDSAKDALASIVFERLAPAYTAGPGDTASTHWSKPDTLFKALSADSTAWGWNGTEYLQDVNGTEYLAGFTAFGQPPSPGPTTFAGKQGIAIARLTWYPTTDSTFFLGPQPPGTTAVNDLGSPNAEVRMSLSEFRPGARRISWQISTPRSLAVQLNVYDVMGRKRRALVDGVLQRGIATVTWDTRDGEGSLVRSGMYYVRLSFEGGVRLAALPITR